MLSCASVLRLFVDFLDKGLPTEYSELVVEHLESCPSCAAEAASYQEVIRLVRQLPPTPVPETILNRLRRASPEEDLPSSQKDK